MIVPINIYVDNDEIAVLDLKVGLKEYKLKAYQTKTVYTEFYLYDDGEESIWKYCKIDLKTIKQLDENLVLPIIEKIASAALESINIKLSTNAIKIYAKAVLDVL